MILPRIRVTAPSRFFITFKFKSHLFSTSIPEHSIALSGSGWLMPFHLGAIQSFRNCPVNPIHDKTVLSGTSGGSIAALLACGDICPDVALNIIIELSRNKEFNNDINAGLKKYIKPHLPSDILERCNGRLAITTTRIWPLNKLSFDATITTHYETVDHLLDVVAASCFIPLYSASALYTKIDGEKERDGLFVDGGVFAFMPPVGEIRVSALPRQLLFPSFLFPLTPHICPSLSDFSATDLLKWSLIPAPEAIMRDLYEKGAKATDDYIASTSTSTNTSTNTRTLE